MFSAMKGLKCGLEIHQQLKGKKLFCACPTLIQERAPEFAVTRKLRAVVGETGEIDAAAAAEALKQKKYVYQCWDECVCLIDLDEAPPKHLNGGALNTAVQVGKLFKASFVDEVQVMRKTIVDGSNTTGFQRTSLVAFDGVLDSSRGTVSIPTVLVEEDSARILESTSEYTMFALDRLGIPLLEISTGPDIVSPEHCAEVAEKIGLFLRSTGMCRRGLGSIRQDVNVSIAGGARVEIKGAQDLKLLPVLVEREVERQESLLRIRDELKKRKVAKVDARPEDVTNVFGKSESKVISSALKNGGIVAGVKLVGFGGLVGREIQPARRLGSEFSDRAKVAAGVGGVFHSDELPKYGITESDVQKVRKHFKCGKNDAFVLVADGRDRARRALHAVVERANEVRRGVPEEVRRALPDGSTTFLRPIPGAARMYPETDVLPIRLHKKQIDAVKLPELIDARMKRYQRVMGKDLALLAAKSDVFPLIDELMRSCKKVKPAFIAETILTAPKTVKKQFNVDIDPSDDDYRALFAALDKGRISKDVVLDVLKENKPVKQVLSKFKRLAKKELEAAVKKIVQKNKGAPAKAIIGKVMVELRGKASGKDIAELVKKHTH